MKGDEADAFDTFVRARLADLLRFGYVLTGNRDAAADLVQDALERTLVAWARVQRRDDPEGYVRRTMVNRHISLWRKHRRERLVEDVPDTGVTTDVELPDARLQDAIARLPQRQRAVLVLRYAEDLSERQVADLLGCSVGTVKSQAFKALAKLRQQLPSDVAGRSADGSPGVPADPPTHLADHARGGRPDQEGPRSWTP